MSGAASPDLPEPQDSRSPGRGGGHRTGCTRTSSSAGRRPARGRGRPTPSRRVLGGAWAPSARRCGRHLVRRPDRPAGADRHRSADGAAAVVLADGRAAARRRDGGGLGFASAPVAGGRPRHRVGDRAPRDRHRLQPLPARPGAVAARRGGDRAGDHEGGRHGHRRLLLVARLLRAPRVLHRAGGLDDGQALMRWAPVANQLLAHPAAGRAARAHPRRPPGVVGRRALLPERVGGPGLPRSAGLGLPALPVRARAAADLLPTPGPWRGPSLGERAASCCSSPPARAARERSGRRPVGAAAGPCERPARRRAPGRDQRRGRRGLPPADALRAAPRLRSPRRRAAHAGPRPAAADRRPDRRLAHLRRP